MPNNFGVVRSELKSQTYATPCMRPCDFDGIFRPSPCLFEDFRFHFCFRNFDNNWLSRQTAAITHDNHRYNVKEIIA